LSPGYEQDLEAVDKTVHRFVNIAFKSDKYFKFKALIAGGYKEQLEDRYVTA
jgi:hypothetical protein